MIIFSNTSIRIKVLIAPVIMIIALGVILSIAISGMENQRRILTNVQQISLKRLQIVQELISTSEQVQSDIYRLSVLQFMRAAKDELLPVSERLEMGLNNLTVIHGEILTGWSLDQKEKDILQELNQSLKTFRHQAQQAVMAISENPSLGILLVRSAAIPFSELRSLLSKLFDYQNAKIAKSKQESEATLDRIRKTIISIAVLMALITLLITIYIGSKYISKPILSITRSMVRLTEGDLSAIAESNDRQDEIGQMEKALNVFRNTAIDKAHVDRQLRESEDRFKNLYNNAQVGLFRTRISDGTPLQINKRYAELSGYATIEECLNNFVASEHYADPMVRERMVKEVTVNGQVNNYEAEIIRKDNQHIWISFSARLYPGDGYIEGALIDITDKRNAESKLVSSLKEKEVLLQEIHHRVKNNLTIISSLLNMQSSTLQDKGAIEALQSSITRVRTMANIHTQLYQSRDLARIDFDQFIRDLVGNISQSYGRTESPVEIKVDVEKINLDIDSSIPCGLILNELIANALKYAFPGGREGEINIAMRQQEKTVTLTVQDNGIGLPETIDLKNLKSLGLELVSMLVAQMNGKMDMRVDGGTIWTITFPLKEEREWHNG
ncbi:MAG: histidine kinase dimerization/phosphoacceptor domain -containing protein [Smithellaceae bacterium]|nr:histidine kinase dimerization/phosphoacceptor domain -containing protein [Smithellaceae bacterium]